MLACSSGRGEGWSPPFGETQQTPEKNPKALASALGIFLAGCSCRVCWQALNPELGSAWNREPLCPAPDAWRSRSCPGALVTRYLDVWDIQAQSLPPQGKVAQDSEHGGLDHISSGPVLGAGATGRRGFVFLVRDLGPPSGLGPHWLCKF